MCFFVSSSGNPQSLHLFVRRQRQICIRTRVTVLAKGAFFARQEMAALPCRTIGLDWNMDIAESRALVGPDKTLQGNLDPCLLYAEPATIRTATQDMLRAFGPDKHIANLGHGVYPDTNPNHVKVFIETVKTFQHDRG